MRRAGSGCYVRGCYSNPNDGSAAVEELQGESQEESADTARASSPTDAKVVGKVADDNESGDAKAENAGGSELAEVKEAAQESGTARADEAQQGPAQDVLGANQVALNKPARQMDKQRAQVEAQVERKADAKVEAKKAAVRRAR